MLDDVDWELRCETWLKSTSDGDAAHGLDHIKRVVANAKRLSESSGANLSVVVPAAWLHDCVSVAKDSPLRSQASALAAKAACEFLETAGYSVEHLQGIEHAIAAHSFSAGIVPRDIRGQNRSRRRSSGRARGDRNRALFANRYVAGERAV